MINRGPSHFSRGSDGKDYRQQPFENNYQTPYDHFTKPRQPFAWPQPIPPQQQSMGQQQMGQQPIGQQAMTQQPMEQQPWQMPPEGGAYFSEQPFASSSPNVSEMPQSPHPSAVHQDPMMNEQYPSPGGFYGPEQYPSPYQTPQMDNPSPGILAQFQDENGQVDVNKMISTAGQLAQTVQQVAPAVKQVSDLIKGFR